VKKVFLVLLGVVGAIAVAIILGGRPDSSIDPYDLPYNGQL